MILATLMILAATPGAQAADTPSVDQLLDKAIQSVYSGSEESTYKMVLSGNGGEQGTRTMKVLFRRDGKESVKLLIKFLEPADIRGTGMLSLTEKGKAPDQWIYLPELKKVRRIKGGNENESFLGSDFTVGDLSSGDDRDRYEYKVTETDKKCTDGKGSCYVITGTPKGGAEVPYSKKVLEVRKDNFLGTHAELYNGEGKLQKTLDLKAVHEQAGKGWLADKMEMKDLIAGHQTVIEVEKRDSSKTPGDSAFTQTALQR